MELDRRQQFLLAAIVGILAGVAIVGLTVWPFQYGVLESAAIVAGLVVVALVRIVLDTARLGEE